MTSANRCEECSKARGPQIGAAWASAISMCCFVLGAVAAGQWASDGSLPWKTSDPPPQPQRPSATSAEVSTGQLLEENRQERIRLLNIESREDAQLQQNQRTLLQLTLQGFDARSAVFKRLRKENAELAARVDPRKTRLQGLQKVVDSLADARDDEARRGQQGISRETEVNSRQRVLEHNQGLNDSRSNQ